MSLNYSIFLVCHGDLAFELIKLSKNFMCASTDLFPYSNSVQSLENIEQDILQQMDKRQFDHNFILVDLVGGSCWLAANRIQKERSNCTVISGVNLPLLISLQINCPSLDIDSLTEKIMNDAKKGIIKK
jgi:mannose/fructose-specific phosphotransferase system component IIA